MRDHASAKGRLERRRPIPRNGFTLLELLVALALFSLVATMSYGGLRQVLAARSLLLPRLDHELSIYRAAALLADDLRLAAPRPTRDALGSPEPALRALPNAGVILSVTRREPALALLAAQPTLVRVDWRLEGGSLWRDAWPVLDAVNTSQPIRREMLAGVKGLRLAFRGGRQEDDWMPFWPPDGSGALSAPFPLPRGASFVLSLEDGRSLRRVLLVRGGS